MITQHHTEGSWKGYASLDLALTPDESHALKTIAASDDGWTHNKGGENFYSLLLDDSYFGAHISDIRKRLSKAIAEFTKSRYREVMAESNMWLRYFMDGGFMGGRLDPAPSGYRCIHAIIAVTAVRGEIVLPRGEGGGLLRVTLNPGQGIVFDASTTNHSIGPVFSEDELLLCFRTFVKEVPNDVDAK